MTIFTDKVKTYLPRLMKDLSLTKVQAAGIFGNIGTETGGFTAMQEKAPVVKGSRGGYGWLQWTGPRRVKYEKWALAHKLNAASDEANYQYLVQETLIDENKSLIQLKKTTTIEAASETFMKQNLRPGVPNLKSRIAYGRQAFDAVQEQSITNAKTKTAVAVGTGTVVTGTIVDNAHHAHHPWIWIVAGSAVVLALCWLIIHWIHKRIK